MTPEDKLEKYFKSVLKDRELSEEKWAIPSQDLWQSAKVHFPKKKKKDKALLFWWGFGGYCLLVVGYFAAMYFQQVNVSKDLLIANNHLEKQPSLDRAYTNQVMIKTTLETTTTPVPKEVVSTEVKKKGANHHLIKNLENKPPRTAQKQLNKNKSIALHSTVVENVKVEKKSKTLPQSIETTAIKIPTSADKQISIKKVPITQQLIHPIALLDIATRPLNQQKSLPVLTTPAQAARNKWEIGLSYSPFVLLRTPILNDGLTSSVIEIQHQNINFSIRRFIHPIFSLSSGVYLSKGGIDLSFCDKITYDKNKPSTFNYFLRVSDTPDEINFSDTGIDIDATIDYKADANLQFGDTLTVKGGIPFKIKFVQMPLLLNVHLGKRKLKGFLHAGISMDYQQLKANEFTLDVFKANELISKPMLVEEPLHEQSFHLRWHAGFGVRYAITNFIEVGSAININISEPILSRYDFGVYYGF